MKCKYCGTGLPNGTNFCTNCGKDLSNLNKCFKCGEIIDDDVTFCPHCGVEQPVYDEGGTNRKWIWGIAALLLIAAVAGGYYYMPNRHSNAHLTEGMPMDSTSTDTLCTDTVASVEKAVEEIPFGRILKAMKYDINVQEEDEKDLSHTLKALGYSSKEQENESDNPNEHTITYCFYKGCELDNELSPINIKREEVCLITESFAETHTYPTVISISVFQPENLKQIEQVLNSQRIEYDKSTIEGGWRISIYGENFMNSEDEEAASSSDDMGK